MTAVDRPRREDFPHIREIPTRWMDNDVYGHVNNVTYYSFFDTVVNRHLIDEAGLNPAASREIGLVVETQCQYFRELSFPEVIEAAMRVTKLGRTSVIYEIGLFKKGEDDIAAFGHFVHVYVDRETRRPVELPERVRTALQPLVIES